VTSCRVARGVVIFVVTLLVGCASTTPDDDPLAPSRTSGTYLRTLVGVGIDLPIAIELHGADLFVFLDEHRTSLRVTLARGDGWFITDLGQVLGLDASGTRRLAEALRHGRPELDPILAEAGPFDAERTGRLSVALRAVVSGLRGPELVE